MSDHLELLPAVDIAGGQAVQLVQGVAGSEKRFGDPVEIPSGTVLVVAMLGLAANLVAFALLREGSKESLNVEGAYLEVL